MEFFSLYVHFKELLLISSIRPLKVERPNKIFENKILIGREEMPTPNQITGINQMYK